MYSEWFALEFPSTFPQGWLFDETQKRVEEALKEVAEEESHVMVESVFPEKGVQGDVDTVEQPQP